MVVYECTCCNFVTNLRTNYESHLKTKKHSSRVKSSPKVAQNIAKSSPISNNFPCEYCGQKFKHKSSMYKHIKYTCTKNKDEDIKELVRLMNLQLEQKDKEINLKLEQKDKEIDMHKKQLETQSKQLETQSKQIEKLVSKLEINGSFNTFNIQNIQLRSFKDTDYSHLTKKDYVQCINQHVSCVKKFIEKVHFNPTKPENMNIKDKYLMIYENGNWNIKTKKIELDSLYKSKEVMLEDWIKVQDNYPELKEKFNKYLHDIENDETLNDIKEEIKMMMYNKRNLIES
jgi:hypothetical protein